VALKSIMLSSAIFWNTASERDAILLCSNTEEMQIGSTPTVI